MKKIISKYPFFIYFLPLFFVLHGYNENYTLIPTADITRLIFFYLGCTIIIHLLCWILYKDIKKASIACLIIMSMYFFFGAFHDGLKLLFSDSFISKYKFVLPFLLLSAVASMLLLKKSISKFKQAFIYLNSILLIFVIIEVFSLIKKMATVKPIEITLNKDFKKCTNCSSPDIFLIIADGYTSNAALNEVFKFDNSVFEKELKQRNFHVINNSFSNYNATAYSMTSMLHLEYLTNLKGLNDTKENLEICYENIKRNQVVPFLDQQGYRFYNYSDFNFPGNPAATNPTFLLGSAKVITSQTLSGRIYKDLWYHLATDLKLKSVINKYVYWQLDNNNKIIKLTKKIAEKETTSPKFVYSHLVMPHNPYYFDKNGNPVSLKKLQEFSGVDRVDFIEYLQYCNKKILDLIDHIKEKSVQPPVIILMGDHGFRQFNDSTDKKYYFMNLSSFSIPGRNYSAFKDSSSMVNQMRTFLNIQFKQNLPLLKDSTVFIQQ